MKDFFKNTYSKITAVFLGVITAIASVGTAVPDITVHLYPFAHKQTISGFGTSACWWSPNVSDSGTREDIAKKLFSKEGLGLNIYRYNVGGGINPEHERVKSSWTTTESFYYFNEESGKWEYDFTRDAKAQAVLFEALKYGCIDTVVLFANSPHYSMTVSGESSGGVKDGDSNLAKEHYQNFVDYFLTITEYFLSKGVPVKYISPVNEPQWGWGGDGVHQEGCHYEADEVAELLRLFSLEIDKRGLDVKLSIPESGEPGKKSKEYFKAIAKDKDTMKNVGSFSYHSYWKDDDTLTKSTFGTWYSLQGYSDIPLDMTEWCELPNKHDVTSPVGAAIMARVIANDFFFTKANSWTSWVAVNGEGINGKDGLDYCDGLFTQKNNFESYSETYRYYAFGQYSKFIPKGSVMIGLATTPLFFETPFSKDITDSDFVAFKTPDGDIVLVIVNEGKAKKIKIDFRGKGMEVYTTDPTHKLEKTYEGKMKKTVDVSESSINTVVIHR